MTKNFFKVFSPETSAKRLKILTSFIDYKNEKLPKKVFLRDRFDNMWPIEVIKTGRDIYFEYGWEKFIEENNLEFGDFLIFNFDENKIFNFKLLGITGCEKKICGGLKLAVKEEEIEEMNVEHLKNVEPKGKNWASDSNSSSSDNDSNEDKEYEEDEEEQEEEEEDNERAGKFNKKAPRSKAGCKRATARKVSDRHDPFGKDIFRSGRASQPNNPYFVAKIRPNRTDQLYIPIYVVKDYKLELPSSMIICDSTGREFEAKVRNWKDGRIWLVGGCRSLCKWNLVELNNKCICEFVRGKHDKDLYLQVHFLPERASSHANRK